MSEELTTIRISKANLSRFSKIAEVLIVSQKLPVRAKQDDVFGWVMDLAEETLKVKA
jgi:hypothetical protein